MSKQSISRRKLVIHPDSQEYAPAFGQHQITFSLFHHLDQFLLMDMGIHIIGHRLQIMQAVKHKRSNAEKSERIYQLNTEESRRTPFIVAAFEAMLGGRYILMGDLTKAETIEL